MIVFTFQELTIQTWKKYSESTWSKPRPPPSYPIRHGKSKASELHTFLASSTADLSMLPHTSADATTGGPSSIIFWCRRWTEQSRPLSAIACIAEEKHTHDTASKSDVSNLQHMIKRWDIQFRLNFYQLASIKCLLTLWSTLPPEEYEHVSRFFLIRAC